MKEVLEFKNHLGLYKKELKNSAMEEERKVSSQSSLEVKKKGCSCGGSCSNKRCGCVKKEAFCEDNCKCSINKCQNQVIVLLLLLISKN